MSLTEIYNISEQHANCTACPNCKNRKTEKVFIGHGMADALGLFVIEAPIFSNTEEPAPYGSSSEEYKMMKAIWSKCKIDPDLWFITTALGCRGTVTSENLTSCRTRLSDITQTISPKIVVLAGPKALWAFTGTTAPYGLVKVEGSPFTIFHVHDYNAYITEKVNNKEQSIITAAAIMREWTQIKEECDKYQKS